MTTTLAPVTIYVSSVSGVPDDFNSGSVISITYDPSVLVDYIARANITEGKDDLIRRIQHNYVHAEKGTTMTDAVVSAIDDIFPEKTFRMDVSDWAVKLNEQPDFES